MSRTRHVHEVTITDGRSASIEELVSRVIPGRLLGVLYELVWCTLEETDVDSVQCVLLEASGATADSVRSRFYRFSVDGYPSDDEVLVEFWKCVDERQAAGPPRGLGGQTPGPLGSDGGHLGSTATALARGSD